MSVWCLVNLKMFVKNWNRIFKRFNHKWIRPEGHDTGIKVYNCITKDKQPLIVKNKNFVTWYTCGPTVYDSTHLGHASCFLKLDIIQRILRHYFNLNLITVMNITDVDDKIIARSNEMKISTQQLTQQYETEFWNDVDALGVNKPDYVLRVTENIDIIRKFIGKLIENKKAYLAENHTVYFDVGAYDNYGKLQSLSDESTSLIKYKKSSKDFALWKSAKPGEVFWESPWGNGRPGWHIECSALASYIFGSEIDIHSGGVDLRFPHHENEEAQSCTLYNKKQWVNYWFHTGHLHLKNNEKMSKSLKNTVSIAGMLKTTNAQTFRMACLMSHYRKHMEYSSDLLSTASDVLQNYGNFMDTCQNYLKGIIQANIDSNSLNKLISESESKIYSALTDDFDTASVIKVLNEVISKVNANLHTCAESTETKSAAIIGVLNFVVKTLNILGISVNTLESTVSDRSFVGVINILTNFRQDVRQLGISNKDKNLLELCDRVRSNLNDCGITLKDHGKVSSWFLTLGSHK